ncbi:PRD domain-containing protein [uncultured Clostridium sp.]|uniref:PRD domain-containing protein n=1 Tax=uncultured Clostridium sp. TaxID=59620 RepID=UPI0025CC10C6|nr:PRD domain-containing protein [uncultured Clostridium sp.]
MGTSYANTLNSRLITIIQRKTLQAAISRNFASAESYALALSIDMKYDRSNISRSLNQLFQDGILVKVQGRPTLYFDKKTLCDYFSLSQLPPSFENSEQLKRALLSSHPDDIRSSVTAFHSLIGTGTNESLCGLVTTVKNVLIYPSPVHGFILSGEPGSGKTAFLHAILDAEIQIKNTLREQILYLDFRKNSDVDISDRFPADVETPPCILVFRSPDTLDNNSYSLFSDTLHHILSGHISGISAFIVICDTLHMQEKLKLELAYAAVSIHLPSWSERTTKEKMMLILKAFQEQCDIIKKPIELSKVCFNNLLCSKYERNLASLRGEVAFVCRNAYANSYPASDTVRIQLDDISSRIFSQTENHAVILSNMNTAGERVNFSTVYFYPSQDNFTFEQVKKLPIDKNGDFLKYSAKPFSSGTGDTDIVHQCENALHTSRSAREVMKTSKTYQILMSVFPAASFSQFLPVQNPPAVYLGLYAHMATVIEQCLSKAYDPESFSVPGELTLNEAVFPATNAFADIISREFDFTLPEYEKTWCSLYLTMAMTLQTQTKIQVFILCRWQRITEVYEEFTASLSAENRPLFFTCENAAPDTSVHVQYSPIVDELASHYNSKGVILISDGPLAPELVNQIFRKLDNNVYYIDQLTRAIVSQAVSFSDDPFNSIEYFARYCSSNLNNGRNLTPENKISTIVKNIIHDSLTFLDSDKLYSLLSNTLNDIQTGLKIGDNDNLTVRFIVHASFMVERSIKRETLPYKRTKEFIRGHEQLFNTVRKNIEVLEKLFNTKIPDTELAYISEIFLDYL